MQTLDKHAAFVLRCLTGLCWLRDVLGRSVLHAPLKLKQASALLGILAEFVMFGCMSLSTFALCQCGSAACNTHGLMPRSFAAARSTGGCGCCRGTARPAAAARAAARPAAAGAPCGPGQGRPAAAAVWAGPARHGWCASGSRLSLKLHHCTVAGPARLLPAMLGRGVWPSEWMEAAETRRFQVVQVMQGCFRFVARATSVEPQLGGTLHAVLGLQHVAKRMALQRCLRRRRRPCRRASGCARSACCWAPAASLRRTWAATRWRSQLLRCAAAPHSGAAPMRTR